MNFSANLCTPAQTESFLYSLEYAVRNINFKVNRENIVGLVGFYGISTIVGYLMPNPLYTYMLNIYDLIWLGFMAYQPLWVI